MDFWDGQTQDQTVLKMEAVFNKERRELIRASAAFGGIEDVSLALPNWYQKTNRRAQPFDFSLSAQRGIVEAVERGFIVGDVWADQVLPMWENLLAATGDLDEWYRRESESLARIRSKRSGRAR